MNKNKLYNKLLTVVSLISITGTIFLLRWIFFQQIDLSYLDNLYSFSQWSIPLSSRIMGDTYLYLHSGTQLIISSFEPFMINPETPIFGKLLFGLSINKFGNPHLILIFSLLILLVTLNSIGKKFFKLDKWHRTLLILLAGTSPIILEQITTPLLDLPQTTLFFIHLYFLLSAGISKQKNKSILYLVTSGIALGAMTATKIALYLPLIFLIDSWYLWKKKKLSLMIGIILTSALTYTLVYSPYIIKHGIINWLKAQKWMLNFYFNSDVISTPGMILITAFTGWYKGWWGSGWERITAWSGSWGIGILATIGITIEHFIKKKKVSDEYLYTLFIVLIILIPLLIIPFWPRYFVFFIPLFWLNLIAWIKNKKIILLLLLFPLLSLFIIGMNSYKFNQNNFYSLWEKASYEDMYEQFSFEHKNKYSRKEWTANKLKDLKEINTYKLEVSQEKPQKITFNRKTQPIKVTKTGFKKVTTTTYQLEWKIERGLWKLNSFNEIQNKTEDINAHSKELGTLCINPTKVRDWSEPYQQVSKLLKITAEEVSSKTMKLAPRNYCIPIGEFSLTSKVDIIFKPGVNYISFD